jgi:hypothetical protein
MADSDITGSRDLSLPLARRKQRRLNRQLPSRYQDELPQPLPLPGPSTPPTALLAAPVQLISPLQPILCTIRNIFGLFRQYYSNELSHDPEEHITLDQLSDGPGTIKQRITVPQPQNTPKAFHPFPNESSFLLGHWYWSSGVQKSRESFKELLRIIGNPEFRPEDVQHTKWGAIDAKLAMNDFDRVDGNNGDAELEWMDEDAGWKRTPVRIRVPFPRRANEPGSRDYLIGDLYHRSLVSVIREKLANSHDDQNFHYDPFELFWKPTAASASVRAHGELYTSPAFIDAHRELQESPGEPGCKLPRVVAAMMFWSDSTHLTSFGDAKLWPCYLFFGNESKYNRCKPTCHLCNHVAYFRTVSLPLRRLALFLPSLSFQMHLKTLRPRKWEGKGPTRPL